MTIAPKDDYRESFTIVAEQSARLARLVDAMFLLSRAEARACRWCPEPLYIDELVAECVRALRVFADERGVTHRDLRRDGDHVLWRQHVAAPDGGQPPRQRHPPREAERVRIRRRWRPTPTAITIAIVNDGDGHPAHDQRERIFQRFVRLDSRSTGAGLGLPIARWIAEAHGGRLTLEPSRRAAPVSVIVLPIA